MLGRLLRRIETFSYGGEVIAVHTIRKDVVIRELKDPPGIDLSVGTGSRDSSHLTMTEVAQLMRVLVKITNNSEDGGNND